MCASIACLQSQVVVSCNIETQEAAGVMRAMFAKFRVCNGLQERPSRASYGLQDTSGQL